MQHIINMVVYNFISNITIVNPYRFAKPTHPSDPNFTEMLTPISTLI